MEPWRVTVVDGRFGRYQGFGIVLAEDAEQARAVVVEYLKNDTAYVQPCEVSEVRRHAVPEPHVLVFNCGCETTKRCRSTREPGFFVRQPHA